MKFRERKDKKKMKSRPSGAAFHFLLFRFRSLISLRDGGTAAGSLIVPRLVLPIPTIPIIPRCDKDRETDGEDPQKTQDEF
jgi:hypothetical protein